MNEPTYILKENLIAALEAAIKHQSEIESKRGENYESALLAGWKTNLESLKKGYKITVK